MIGSSWTVQVKAGLFVFGGLACTLLVKLFFGSQLVV